MIPDDQLKQFEKVQWAPMVDFLFIVVIVFATIAITRNVVQDSALQLVRALPEKESTTAPHHKSSHLVNLSINHLGKYKWLSENGEIFLDNAKAVGTTIASLKKQGVLPAQPHQVKILLHIDKSAPWQPIADVIFAVCEAGYDIHPVYQSSNKGL